MEAAESCLNQADWQTGRLEIVRSWLLSVFAAQYPYKPSSNLYLVTIAEQLSQSPQTRHYPFTV